MAPIYASEIGCIPQIIDDERLVRLRNDLSELKLHAPLGTTFLSPDTVQIPLDIEKLLKLIDPWQSWLFEEQVDLQEWIHPLNLIDACLSYYIQKYPALLLVGPVKRTNSRGTVSSEKQLISRPAESLEEIISIPGSVVKNLCVMLRFLSGLLTNSSNKSVFNSVEELVDLLAAGDDALASAALETLCCLSIPPALHKQQAPEIQQHSTALHTSRTDSHKRLLALARGWGTRGSGLGLYTCSTADDSESGQGALPQQAGELHFSFFKRKSTKEAEHVTDSEGSNESFLVEISLLKKDIVDTSIMATEPLKSVDESDESSTSKQKRRRVVPSILREGSIRSSSDLFFSCLAQIGGRSQVPEDTLFLLLANIRLTRSFHCRSMRVSAIERRLRALIAVLHSHASQEIMSGYFQAQQELCVELVDLLRPTVSSTSVSAASSKHIVSSTNVVKQDAISALANSVVVPYEIRELALQTLTALVARRDGTTGALMGVARHSNILSELGVAKGQYLGLLPTLIRFSLASLGSMLTHDEKEEKLSTLVEPAGKESIAFDIGLAFVEATMPPPLPRKVQLMKALELVDSVLTLTSAVVSTPSGTSSLTECGLIPALLTTVAVDYQGMVENSLVEATEEDVLRIKALLRFVTAQAVQILEGAIVTHSNALSAFHELHGVEVLTQRLSTEILGTNVNDGVKGSGQAGDDSMECDQVDQDSGEDIEMNVLPQGGIQCSQRVLLFSIVTCLTVVFHQESTSSTVTSPSGATELRKPELTKALIGILDNVVIYGGHLASLVATLLSDVMNSDPHVVRHVHESGLAKSFLNFLSEPPESDPILPPVPELIMAVPNVISALALTEDGAKAVFEANPFPAFLRIFYHPKYAMPLSKCLLNEMTAIVGTGLDEMMRHIDSLKPQISKAIAVAMNEVAIIGEELAVKEASLPGGETKTTQPATDLENDRSCLMQYALNFGQILEQILHNEGHCDVFVAAGGLDALLRLYPSLMPTGREFLSHISCLSCPSVSTLGHSTTEDSMALAFKCIALRYDPFKLLQTLINTVNAHIRKLEKLQDAVKQVEPADQKNDLDTAFVLNHFPRAPIYALTPESSTFNEKAVSAYLRQVVTVQWITGLLSAVIKTACQQSDETGTGWSRQEREWKKELSSTAFEELIGRLSKFHRSAIFEVCRLRSEDNFEKRDTERQKNSKAQGLRYRLRIVCPEGAVVRDGIEIDSCASVGSMDMGEISVAFDRCINSSGVLRYRTRRGWVSEQTRGHGREPIAEVLSVWKSEEAPENALACIAPAHTERVESGVPDLQTTGINVLARVQSSYSELFSALSRVIIQGVRSLPVRTLSFQPGTVGAHVATITRILKSEIMHGFNHDIILEEGGKIRCKQSMNSAGLSMYFGCLLSHLRSCLSEEKRERRTVNVPLLIVVLNIDDQSKGTTERTDSVGVFDAIRFIFDEALVDFQEYASTQVGAHDGTTPRRRLGRPTAASFPAATTLLKRLISGPSITTSPVSSVLSRIKLSDLSMLLGEQDFSNISEQAGPLVETFSPEKFCRKVLFRVSETVQDIWIDKRFGSAPPYVVHPLATLVEEIMVCLEDSERKDASNSIRRDRNEAHDWGAAFNRLIARQEARSSSAVQQDDFEPSEDAISRLMEMGFTRDHAWDSIDSTRSNQLEVAMEYALSHPPPSPTEIERRRNERREQQRQREQESEENDSSGAAEGSTGVAQENADSTAGENMDVDKSEENVEGEEEKADETISASKSILDKWKSDATTVSCDILAAMKEQSLDDSYEGGLNGDGDTEALTVVLCTFLLDTCQKYPEQRERVAEDLFKRLDSKITSKNVGGQNNFSICEGESSSFSALCHASVLFTRAIPTSRTELLKRGIVSKILSCIQNTLASAANSEKSQPKKNSPIWLASSLLLLDIMAQPMVAFSDKEKKDEVATEYDPEFKNVMEQHAKQENALSSLAFDLIAALRSVSESSSEASKAESKIDVLESKENSKSGAETEGKKESTNSEIHLLFKSVPAYFPLLPNESSQKCVDICLLLFGTYHNSPGVIHGALMLLMRLLRSPSIAAYCVKIGAAEKILALPCESRFTGHSGLVTLTLRRLLEDESTLQAAMETEIRGAITKLHGKSRQSSRSDAENTGVSRKAFVQAITPLLCRDPETFLKSLAVTVRFEKPEGNSDGKVTLLSSSERMKNMKILSDTFKRKISSKLSRSPSHRRSSFSKAKRSSSSPRSKTPVRSNKRGVVPKKSKKDKAESKEKVEDELKSPPANHVIGLLINSLIKVSTPGKTLREAGRSKDDFNFGFETGFLWAADILGILSDLVLAIPACATAIHKFRYAKSKLNRAGCLHLTHALEGSPAPPKTFVNLILHSLLIQDRWSKVPEHQAKIEGISESQKKQFKEKKEAALQRKKMVQSSARLLVALVARPGEGRRRVIADLVFALSGGQLGLPNAAVRSEKFACVSSRLEVNALQAWGELCIGLAAPRSSGTNYDGHATLSFEVIRIMLDTGMAHALLVAMHLVPLNHPRATTAVGALLLPFEVLSRPSVTDGVRAVVEKENSLRDSKVAPKPMKPNKDRNSERHDSFADDHMLEEAFGIDAARNENMEHRAEIDNSFVHQPQEDGAEEGGHDYIIAQDDPEMEEIVDDENEMDIDENEDEEDVSDDDMSSRDDSDDSTNDEESDDDESDGEDDEDDELDDDESDSIVDEDESVEGETFDLGDFDGDHDEDIIVNDDGFDSENPGDGQRQEQSLEDGWTRIESTGFGGMMLGGRRGIGQQMSGNVSARTRGFIDAAEAMIGTLLRTGEIHGDALAEIEGSLGIRIMRQGGSGSSGGLQRSDASRSDGFGIRNGGIRGLLSDNRQRDIGTLPQVHQHSQPDVGYPSLVGGGRWSEISSMEYIYGGPSMTTGSRNYDLIPRPEEIDDDESSQAAGDIDTPLFPGGPASVAHARTQHSLHPLLCGVDLPPVNALVSDLLPHGARATRRGQMSTRRPGDWNSSSFSSGSFLVSTSNGNIVRSNRGSTGLGLSTTSQQRGGSGPMGWTDDGLPFDASVEQLSAAFEQALGESISSDFLTFPQTSNEDDVGQEDVPSNAGNRTNDGGSDATGERNESADAPNIEASQNDNSEQPSNNMANEGDNQSTVDGDGVASSLAASLRLSASSEETGQALHRADSDIQMAEASTTENSMSRNGQESENIETEESEMQAGNEANGNDDTVQEEGNSGDRNAQPGPSANGLVCPPGMDPEVFFVLPLEMQQEVVQQAREVADVASQLDAGSSLDPEALAALPEDMRRAAIEQEQRERRMQEQAPADPANAEEMDNASFVASLASPELRREILMNAEDSFLQSLPPNIIAEAQILRERASMNRRMYEEPAAAPNPAESNTNNATGQVRRGAQAGSSRETTENAATNTSRRKQRPFGKIRVECDREAVVYLPDASQLSPPIAKVDLKSLLRLMYLLSPVRPHKLLQRVFQNLIAEPTLRRALVSTLVKLLHDNSSGALLALSMVENDYAGPSDWRFKMDSQFGESLENFPPPSLLGAAPELLDTQGLNSNITLLRRKQMIDTATSIAANLPVMARGSCQEGSLPPVVATRIIDALQNTCKSSPRFCVDVLVNSILDPSEMQDSSPTGFEKLLDLLGKHRYSKSSANLEQLLVLLESAVTPLSHLPKHGEDDAELSQKDLDAASSSGKEWVDVPRIVVSQERLQLLCSVLRMETCRDVSFTKVNTIARRLCRVDANRGYVLAELASVARALGEDAMRDLKALSIRMSNAVEIQKSKTETTVHGQHGDSSSIRNNNFVANGSASSSVAVSTSTSELKLLRVLQTLQALCVDTSEETPKKNEPSVYVTDELVQLLRAMQLDDLWAELTACLNVVQVLEGVKIEENKDKPSEEGENEGDDENAENGKKLQNSVAGLLTRFLPSIEAFFVANASATRSVEKINTEVENEGPPDENDVSHLVGGNQLVDFVDANKVLLNALIRSNASLLDKGLRALIQVPRCRHLLDFDVKRHWFKSQVRRLRQHAHRRHGSLRLSIRRKHVFEDAYNYLGPRTAEEMRGRLHITFRNEEGVDAGGLSREFFGILAKEIFNPNYALFTSTEDGSTFQPNQNSSINPDHLHYFRFVGRIVGKAVLDGYLLDAHFTRSLYKHMLGIKPTHHDMEAIDPDYYKNLKTILEYNLGDLGLELTFSMDDHSFGRNQMIDLIPDGRNVAVTEQNKAKYVSLVCQYRMTTAIKSQIKAYLDGFYELVSRDLITIFTPRELELLISGLPDIDVHDLKQNTDYVGWKATDPQIQWFWNVLFSLSRNQKAAFLQFATGSSKVPLAGFGELPGMRGVQKFSIHKAGGNAGALMSAHTCFNSIELPVYSNEEELKQKLLYAITEGGGTFLMA